MDDEALNQRIKYLMEHGGVWDDPVADIRRKVNGALVFAALSVAMSAVHLGWLLLH